MKAVVQRVRSASVAVGGTEVARIGRGLLVLVGVACGDLASDAAWLARKIAGLRVFADDAGKMNRSVAEVGGAVLAVSQFTLLGDCRAGRRPSFVAAAPPEEGRRLYESFLAEVRAAAGGVPVRAGVFGADMLVALENDGPVTFILDSDPRVRADQKYREIPSFRG
ncbi:MAG TPA: D-aminoacyl-tRNA deacylase [bacterium]